MFTDRLTCAFWAGLPVPPEVAVIPSKRVWSGQISGAMVRACLDRYQPELLLLGENRLGELGLSAYVPERYKVDASAAELGLYLRKPPPPPNRR